MSTGGLQRAIKNEMFPQGRSINQTSPALRRKQFPTKLTKIKTQTTVLRNLLQKLQRSLKRKKMPVIYVKYA